MNTNLIITDNFYTDPDKVRKWVLEQPFDVRGNYPGQRTQSYATIELKNIIEKYIELNILHPYPSSYKNVTCL